ncbi:MAG: hypothetical protein IJS15_12665 [Victivallales bacterium]|nr:hypothetical protein [Victivallales bacterium]
MEIQVWHRLLSIIYEARLFVEIPLFLICLTLMSFLLARRKKTFFVCLAVLPLVIFSIDIAATYCGWLYRMELRRIYATASDKSINIERMPPQIREEYAKHDYHPRFRDIKAKLLGVVLATPLIIIVGIAIWLITAHLAPHRADVKRRQAG